MKKFIMLTLIGLFFISCSKDDSGGGSNLSSTPDAKAEFDASNFGIYKGVFIGSSGIVTININNGGTISATLVIDGTTHNFTTTESVTADTTISGLTFTNGSSSFDFNVNGTGGSPEISNISISGHPNATINLIKEESTAIVKCYEGTFSGSDSGVLNVMISKGFIYGLGKSNNNGVSGAIFGTVVNNIIDGIAGEVTKISGTVNGDSVNGTWLETDNSSHGGTWTGHRTL